MRAALMLLALGLSGVVALVVLVIAVGISDDHEGKRCAIWMPIQSGKVTVLTCVRWESAD